MRFVMAAVAMLLGGDAAAEVVRIDVDRRRDVLSGKSFGLAGGYEILEGRIHFAFDPGLEPNRIVTDIDKAPLDDRGRVTHSADFCLVKPRRLDKGNQTLLLEVGNRGGKGLLSFFNLAAGSLDPSTAENFGDGFLLERGFTLLWVGWQWDTPGALSRARCRGRDSAHGERYLLAEDLPRILESASRHWDYRVGENGGAP